MKHSHSIPPISPRSRRLAAALGVAALCTVCGAASAQASPTSSPITQISTSTGYAQTPVVTIDGAGKTAAVWRDSNTETMYIRSLAADGTPGTAHVLGNGGGYLNVPSAAASADGTVGVVWQQIAYGSYQQSIQFASVAPDGTVRPPVTLGTASASTPVVSYAKDGTGWVSWVDSVGSDYRVVAAHIAADGTVGPETPVSPEGGDAEQPQVAVAPNGRAWIAWTNNDDTLGAAYAPAGGGFAAPHTIAAEYPHDDSLSLAIDGQGNGTLVFEDDPSAIEYAIDLVKLPAGGTPGAPTLLEESDSETYPRVASRSDGSGIVSWTNDDVVKSASFDAAGTPSAIRTVSDPTLSQQRDVAPVAVGDGGESAVIWYQDDLNGNYEVKMRRYAADGTPSGIEDVSGPLPLDTPAAGEIAIGNTPSGTFVPVWTARASNNTKTVLYGLVEYAPPVNTSAPSLDPASPTVGATVNGAVGSWAGTAPLAHTYQWLRCTSATDAGTCTPIAGQTTSSYATTSADEGRYLRLAVTTTNIVDQEGVTAVSAASRVSAAPVVTPTPAAQVTPTPSPAATPAPVAAAPAAPAATPAPVAAAPAVCSKSRVVDVHWKVPAKVSLRGVTITLDGKTFRQLGGRARSTTLPLSATGPRLFKVNIVGRATNGKRYESKRNYRLCNPDVPFEPAGALTLAKAK